MQFWPWHGFVSSVCVHLAKRGLRSPKGGPPLYMKKKLMSEIDFKAVWCKKYKIEKWRMTPAETPPTPPIVENSTLFYFLNPSLIVQRKRRLKFSSMMVQLAVSFKLNVEISEKWWLRNIHPLWNLILTSILLCLQFCCVLSPNGSLMYSPLTGAFLGYTRGQIRWRYYENLSFLYMLSLGLSKHNFVEIDSFLLDFRTATYNRPKRS